MIAIFLTILAALIAWSVPTRRRSLLLVFSLIALYALQADSHPMLAVLLPSLTLALVIGVWWLVTPAPTDSDRRWLAGIAIGGMICAVVLTAIRQIGTNDSISMHWSALTGLGMLAVLISAIGLRGAQSVSEPTDDSGRRRIALLFILAIIALFAVVKIPAIQGTVSSAVTGGLPITWGWIGFSYIAFRLLHVLLDYRIGRLAPISLPNFALYVIFFPAITAGPIARVEQFARELNADAHLDRERLIAGCTRIGIGLLKKFVIADTLARIALNPAMVAQNHSAAIMWLMVYAYALQLFLDFSGYVDIAIGTAQLAGIALPENFIAPYTKRNLTAFWNSWHITLSTWFRLYFFTPFSRMLMTTPLRSRKLLVILLAQVATMVLIGLWHGVALNFVLWGAWHGVGLWLLRAYTERARRWDAFVADRPWLSRIISMMSWLATFHFVAIGWIFFALPDPGLIRTALLGLIGQ